VSDTPETDAVLAEAAAARWPLSRLAMKLTVKCERLERERDELRAALEAEVSARVRGVQGEVGR
jgi:hypothetical protein